MKVLLLGDYSSLGVALKEGLLQLGIDVTLAANGDGWKKISGADTCLFPASEGGQIDKFKKYVLYPLFTDKFKGYDIVQAPGTDIFFWRFGTKPFEKIIRDNGKFFINAAGVDYYLYHSWKNGKLKYDYYMYDDNEELCSESNGKSISSIMKNIRCKKIMKMAYGIIPVVPYEYEISYSNFSNIRKPILLPVNTDKYGFMPNEVKNKIVFFHGINRAKDKGSGYIQKAMSKLQERYPNDVECIVAERMPFDEYTRNLNRTNVVIDQCKSFGYGLNACISMAKGKIVLSGAENAVTKYFNGDKCPVFNIRPDVKNIYNQMVRIIELKSEIPILATESRKFIEKYHNYINIAKQYVDAWLE